MIDFSNVKQLYIPEGKVKSITDATGTILWKEPVSSLVLTSIDSSGALYNGTGYKIQTRLSGSSGNETAFANASITGFISVLPGDVIRMQYVGDNPKLWDTLSSYSTASSWVYFTNSFGYLGSVVPVQGSRYGICTSADFPTGGLADRGIVIGNVPSDSRIAYMRVSVAIASAGYNAAGQWVSFDQSLEPLIVVKNTEL